MARDEARLFTSIWRDEDWRSLSIEAQWLYEAILSQPDLSKCGVLSWTPKRMALLANNGDAKKLQKARDELAAKRFLLVDDDTEEVMVRTFLRHDGVLDLPNMVVGMAHEFCLIHSEELRYGLLHGLGVGFLDGLADRFPKANAKGLADRFPKGFLVAFLAYERARGHAHVPQAPIPKPLAPTGENGVSSNHRIVEPVENQEEEITLRVEEACRLVAERRLRAQPAGRVQDPNGWMRKVARKVLADDGPGLRRWARQMSAEQLADRLEPLPPSPYPPPGHVAGPTFDLDDDGFAVPVAGTG